MKLNRSTLYALYAASEMALAGEGLVTVAQVAERHGIPEGALAKVFQQLVRARIALGTRGVGGGYRLARTPRQITVQDVINAFEPARDPGAGLIGDGDGGESTGPADGRIRALFDEVDELVRCTFESITLDTLVRGAR